MSGVTEQEMVQTAPTVPAAGSGRLPDTVERRGNGVPAGPRRLLLVLVLTCYNTWLLAPWLWVGPTHPGFLSDLAAQDQQWQWVFRGGDMLSGGLLLAVAVLGLRPWRRWLTWWAPGLVAGTGLAGGATLADSVANLPCSVAVDPACEQSPSLALRLHEVSSVLASTGFLVMLITVFLGLRLARGWSRATRLAATAAALVAATDVAIVLLEALRPGAQLWPQIAETLVYDVLFVVVIAHLGPDQERA